MAKVFLIGATSYAGQCVLPELMARGHMVTALVREPAAFSGCRTIVADPPAIDRYSSEVAASDAVIHLASGRSLEQSAILRDDVLGTSLLIDAWSRGPFVYASSPTIHGVPLATVTESSPIHLMSGYAIGKFANEFQLRLAGSPDARGPAVSLRPGIPLAPNDRRRDRQFFGALIDRCKLGRTFIFTTEEGAETSGWSFIGGADFGRAVADSLTIKVSGAYNIATGFCTWRQLINAINRATGSRAQVVVRAGGETAKGELRLPQSRTMLDTTAFARETGFVPRQSLEELLEEFVRADRAAHTA
jgi:nucleoside-diphosphate-sugar epimerase